MRLKFNIKHDKKRFTAGKYSGGLPKDVEEDLIKKGYFDMTGGDVPEPVDGLSLDEISDLSVSKLKSAAENLNDEEVMALLELEQAKGDKQRSSVVKHLEGMLE